jgi:iron complex outermembrane receptor protein
MAALVSSPSYAQTTSNSTAAAAPDEDQLQPITVTAERRSENSQKVPISIVAISNDTLVSQGITNVSELQNAVPGLNVTTQVGNTQVYIRGIGAQATAVENDVGIYVDGVYVASQLASLLNLSNIDHIEILKGPQGTLFGRNAIGGALSIVTKDPSQTAAADISIGYANYDTVTTNFYGTTGISENLATDLALYYSDQGNGWGRDLTTGQPTFRDREIQLRNKWLFTPTDGTRISLGFDYSNAYSELGSNYAFLPGAVGLDGVSTYAGFYNTLSGGPTYNSDEQYGSTLRIDQDFSWARGVSITGYRASRDNAYVDQDATPLPIFQVGPGIIDDTTYTEELQLLSLDSSKVKWIVGAFYLNDKFYLPPPAPGFNINVPGATINLRVNDPTKSYAGFGQATAEILPATNLTVGLRYTYDDKSIAGETYINDMFAAGASQRAIFSKVTYRASLDHQFTSDILGYVSFDTGFKSGQFDPFNYNEHAVKPEQLNAGQAGLKSDFLDHRLRLNVAGFYYDYNNIQLSQNIVSGTSGTTVLLNAARATMYGLDVDSSALLTSNLKVDGSLSLLHGRYDNFPNAPSYVPTVSPVTGLPTGGDSLATIANAKGTPTIESPDVTAYLAVDYTVPLAPGKLEFNVNASYDAGFYWQPDDRLKQPSYTLLGAYVKWASAGGRWDVRVWGKNLTNARYYEYEQAFSSGDVGSSAPPATYGVTFGVHL